MRKKPNWLFPQLGVTFGFRGGEISKWCKCKAVGDDGRVKVQHQHIASKFVHLRPGQECTCNFSLACCFPSCEYEMAMNGCSFNIEKFDAISKGR